MSLRVTFDAPVATVADDQLVGGLRISFDGDATFAEVLSGTATQATIFGGPPGPRGPAGVVVINSNESTPPPGTPVGTIIYQRV